MALEIKAADELIDAELEARWAVRRAARQTTVLQRILRIFVDRGGPVAVETLVAASPDLSPEGVRKSLIALDEEDLIQVREGQIDIAYPFSAAPTSFVMRLLPDGGERYACCEIDALGMAPMLGQRIAIRSHCHHCALPVELSVTPEGPEPGCEDLMVWVGKQAEGERRVATSL